MLTLPTSIILILLSGIILAGPRKYLLPCYLFAAVFVPADQRILVFDLDFTVLRIMVLAGMVRIFMRSEVQVGIRGNFDKWFWGWSILSFIMAVSLWHDRSDIILRMFAVVFIDTLGLYWIFRQIVRDGSDVKYIIAILAVYSLILLPFVAYEYATGRNPFLFLGRVITEIRQGSYRCQGSFPHSIILGLFWATVFPFFMVQCRFGKARILYWLAAGASIFIVVATASSTPLLTLPAVIVFFSLFNYRKYGKFFALGFCALTFALHMVMDAPVWHLISRVGVVTGSTAWHRYYLIDNAIRHFGEWALTGTRSTAHWGHVQQDITNHFILEGVRGGILRLGLFVLLMILSVKIPGSYSLEKIPRDRQWLSWSIAVCMLGHCISFFGVSYFGQILIILFLTLACVAMISERQSLGGAINSKRMF